MNPLSAPDYQLKNRSQPLILAAVSSGALVAAPFLHPGFFPLAWIAFVPLFWAVERAGGPRRAFLVAWLAGAAAHLMGFYWVDHTVRVFGGIPYGLSEIVLLGFSILAGFHIALFGLLVYFCGLGPLMIFPPLLWVAVEFFAPQLFPWHLANSQSAFLVFIQTADLTGPYGAGFLLAWANAVLYALLFLRARGARVLIASAAVLALALAGNFIYGHLRLKEVSADMRAARTLEIAAVQGSIDILHKWNVTYLESNLKSYLDLTRTVPNAALYLWPESTVEAWVPEDAERMPPEFVPALPPGAALIFGARSFRGAPDGPDMKAFNSAFAVDSAGRVLGHYHKQVLLAFGEYIPFAPVLAHVPFMPPIGEGFTRGAGPATLDLPGGVKAAPLICYEDIMPELARRFVREKGANLLVNLTNDAWFGDTVASRQHARLAEWRSIETRRTLVRVTNTGLTAVVNPKGEITAELPIFSKGVLTAKVEIMEGETPYVKYGDWFGWGVTIIALGVVGWRWRRRQIPA
ncbi:MAG TPA: apolipoprotein N-acyltransferase [Candidatus Binatia bacterium]